MSFLSIFLTKVHYFIYSTVFSGNHQQVATVTIATECPHCLQQTDHSIVYMPSCAHESAPNSILISSAVFAKLTGLVTDTQTTLSCDICSDVCSNIPRRELLQASSGNVA